MWKIRLSDCNAKACQAILYCNAHKDSTYKAKKTAVVPGEERATKGCRERPKERDKTRYIKSVGLSKAASIPFVVHITRDRSTRNGNYYCRAPPPVCRLSVYLMSSDVTDVTKSPRPSSSEFVYCKQSNTGGNGLGARL